MTPAGFTKNYISMLASKHLYTFQYKLPTRYTQAVYSAFHKYLPPRTFPHSVVLQPRTEMNLIGLILYVMKVYKIVHNIDVQESSFYPLYPVIDLCCRASSKQNRGCIIFLCSCADASSASASFLWELWWTEKIMWKSGCRGASDSLPLKTPNVFHIHILL